MNEFKRIYLQLGTEYKYELIEWLVKEYDVCCYYDYYDQMDKFDHFSSLQNVHQVPMGKLLKPDFFENFNVNELPPLEQEFLEKMKKYESMALKLVMRDTEYPIAEYEKSKFQYFNYIRYWKAFLETEKIEHIYFEETPHSTCKYTLYAVAKVLGIDTFMITPTGIRGQHVYGHDIAELGANIGESYKHGDIDYNNVELTGAVKSYYENALNKESEASVDAKTKEQWKKFVYGVFYKKYDVKIPILSVFKHDFRVMAAALLKHRSLSWYKKYKYTKLEKKHLEQVKVLKKYDLCTLEDYQKIAVQPDYSKKYVYFPLQQNPELTMFPLAGEFAEQYTTIQLLAKILEPYGIYVYVKEYYIQKYRENHFWEALRGLKNVIFIDCNIPSNVLIEHSIAVASQTGTVLLEGVFEDKPALAFGDGSYWKGMPGVFFIHNYQEGIEVVEKYLNEDYTVDKNELLKYFKCIEANSIFYYVNKDYKVEEKNEQYYKCLKDMEELIVEQFGL